LCSSVMGLEGCEVDQIHIQIPVHVSPRTVFAVWPRIWDLSAWTGIAVGDCCQVFLIHVAIPVEIADVRRFDHLIGPAVPGEGIGSTIS